MVKNMLEFKRFTSPQDVDVWVAKHFNENQLMEFSAKDNLDSALGTYKCSGYRWINEGIRIGGINSNEVLELQKMLMQQAIPESIQTFRFVSPKELSILIWKTRRRHAFNYPGFLSTTLLPEYYSMNYIKDKRILISFFIEKGVSGMYLPEVNPNMPEFEILFPHHLKIKRIQWNQYLIKYTK